MHARADVPLCVCVSVFLFEFRACMRGHLHRVRDIHAGHVHGTEEEQ
jgi:hypothetical protein